MSNLLYWVIPVAAVAIIGMLMALRERRPQAPDTSVSDFSRQMSALSKRVATRYPHDGERKQAV
ncbi:MAG: hypothetical protein M0Z47_07170 [Actinomycetota bacterium]|nr:hypothetical protein [Actinomycetota bacterium]